jgi:hypothetical protein
MKNNLPRRPTLIVGGLLGGLVVTVGVAYAVAISVIDSDFLALERNAASIRISRRESPPRARLALALRPYMPGSYQIGDV